MGLGESSVYRPNYPTLDADTGDTLSVIWYCHRDAPSLIPWAWPSTVAPPRMKERWVQQQGFLVEDL